MYACRTSSLVNLQPNWRKSLGDKQNQSSNGHKGQCFRVSENCTWSNFPATRDVVSARARFISVAKDTIAGAIADTVGQCFETGYCEALRWSTEVMKISRRTSQTTDNVFEILKNVTIPKPL